MIPFLASWKTWLGVAVIAAGGLSLLLPAVSAFVVAFLQTQIGRVVAVIVAGTALLWFAYAYVDANAYARGATETITKIEKQDQKAIDAARKARIPVAECYARDGEWSVEDGTCVLPQ